MKLTKNKWANFVILKIAEGLGVALFGCLVWGFILLLIANPAMIPYFEWAGNILVVIAVICVIVFLGGTLFYANLEWAEKLRRK